MYSFARIFRALSDATCTCKNVLSNLPGGERLVVGGVLHCAPLICGVHEGVRINSYLSNHQSENKPYMVNPLFHKYSC